MLKTVYDQTRDTFRFRWNNYQDSNRKFHRSDICMQDHLSRHLSIDASITFIDKTNLANPLKCEDFWRKTLENMAPYGLKVLEYLQKTKT